MDTSQWPGRFDERGDGILPNPFQGETSSPCNQPYLVNGEIVGYCDLRTPLVSRPKRWWRRAQTVGKHDGPHALHWTRPGVESDE